MPLIELNLEGLERVRRGELDLVQFDLAGDLELMHDKLSTGKVRLIGIHLDDALNRYKNEFMVKLELHEIERYLRDIYRQIGYSISPSGEKWTLSQLEAQRMMKELNDLIPRFKENVQSKLDMSKVLANYQVRCQRLSPQAGEQVKACADAHSKGEMRQCAMHIFKARKELARYILKNS